MDHREQKFLNFKGDLLSLIEEELTILTFYKNEAKNYSIEEVENILNYLKNQIDNWDKEYVSIYTLISRLNRKALESDTSPNKRGPKSGSKNLNPHPNTAYLYKAIDSYQAIKNNFINLPYDYYFSFMTKNGYDKFLYGKNDYRTTINRLNIDLKELPESDSI